MIPSFYHHYDDGRILELKRQKNNIILSEKICEYVYSIIPFSDNDPERSEAMLEKVRRFQEQPHDDEAKRDVRALIDSIRLCIKELRRAGKEIREKYPQLSDPLNAVCTKAALAQKFNVGNCNEMAALGFANIYNKVPQRVEMFVIDGGDHVFLVIGRRKGSNPQDPRTWGTSAVVCDPWAKAVYPASEIPKKLVVCMGTKSYKDSPRETSITEPFDPNKHKLLPFVEYPGRR